MKSLAISIMGVFLLFCFLGMTACDKSTDSDHNYDFPDPIDSVATDITLTIYSVFNGSLLQTTQLETESSATIEVADTGMVIAWGFNIYARADGFYTKLYYRNNGDTLTVDLDAVPQMPYSITGVIFSASGLAPHCYYANRHVDIIGPANFHKDIVADDFGRFGLGDIPSGTYTFGFDDPDNPWTFDTVSTVATDYVDILYTGDNPVRAPYIYLYPDEQTDVSISLDFLQGGRITQAEPPYGDGWNVNVTPDGTIDGQYDYIFYEGNILHLPNSHSGWILSGDNLETEISELLSGLGFAENEISDFADYWIPEIEGHPYYAFLYMNPDSVIGLDVNPVPDNILRIFFVIHPLENPVQLQAPELPGGFSRDGFAVAEWGVIGWR